MSHPEDNSSTKKLDGGENLTPTLSVCILTFDIFCVIRSIHIKECDNIGVIMEPTFSREFSYVSYLKKKPVTYLSPVRLTSYRAGSMLPCPRRHLT
jgi:hypothetical protein